jgi:hypothetical protein
MSKNAAVKKVEVYTDEVMTRLKSDYLSAKTKEERKEVIQTSASELGVKPQSVIAKLSRAGVYIAESKYVPKGKKSEDGEVMTKESLADEIAKVIEMTDDEVLSLTKANKAVLQKILEALQS